MTFNATRTYYDSDALRHGYQQAVKKRLANLLTQVDFDNTLGQHKSTWYPDANTRVTFDIQPGITGRMIDVKVEHVRPEGKPAKPRMKIKKDKKPYMWLGLAAVNHTGKVDPVEQGGLPSYGMPVEAFLYGFDPEPSEQNGGYTWCNAVEISEGAFMPCWPGCAQADLGSAADCAGIRSEQNSQEMEEDYRWLAIAGGPAGSVSFDGDLGEAGVTFMDDLDELGGSDSIDIWGKVSDGGILLTQSIGTQITAPDAAYDDDHPIDFWQVAAQIDADGIRPHARAQGSYSGHARVYNDLGFNANVQVVDFLFKRPVMAGDYRFEIAAIALSCFEPGMTSEIKGRLIVGKPGGPMRAEGEPGGDIEEDPDSGMTIIDFDCDGIGSLPAETVMDSFYSRNFVLGGAHLYSNGGVAFGQMPADKGFWHDMILVNVKEASHSFVPFEPDFQPFHGASGIPFPTCDCADLCGDIDFSLGPEGMIDTNYYIKSNTVWRDHTGQVRQPGDVGWVSGLTYLYLQPAIVQATCDGRIETVQITKPPFCTAPGYGEGMVFSAVGASLTMESGVPTVRIVEDGWTCGMAVVVAGFQKIFREFPTGEFLPNATAAVLFVAPLGDADNVANWSMREWQLDYLCSNGRLSFGAGEGCDTEAMEHGNKRTHIIDARNNLINRRRPEGGWEWVPSPVSLCYSNAARGFVFGG